MANPFVHVELMTTDVAKAKAFYGALFDWKLEDIPGMDYTMINVGEGTGGGMMKTVQPDSPSYWMAYVSRGRCGRRHREGPDPRSDDLQGGHRDSRRRLVQRHHRSDRGDTGAVADESRTIRSLRRVLKVKR